MQALEEILNLPSVNKTEVITDLLNEVYILRGKLENSVHMEKALRESNQASLRTMQNLHQEELQKHMDKHAETLSLIQQMDEIAAENTIMVKCRKCEGMYELPVDLSEFDPEYSYCGKGGPSPCTP